MKCVQRISEDGWYLRKKPRRGEMWAELRRQAVGREAERVAELCGEQRHAVLKLGVAWSGFFFVFKERVSNIKKKKIVALWPIILVADWIFDMVVHERIRQHRSSRPGFLLALPFPGLSAHGHATHAEGRLAVAAVMWQSKGSGSASQRQGN